MNSIVLLCMVIFHWYSCPSSINPKQGRKKKIQGLTGTNWCSPLHTISNLYGLLVFRYTIVSTGGTASALEKAGIPVTKVEQITNFPEMVNFFSYILHFMCAKYATSNIMFFLLY